VKIKGHPERGEALNAAIATRPSWKRRADDDPMEVSPTAQHHTNVDRWGFENGPWASVFGGCDGWGWVVWDGGKLVACQDSVWLATPGEALDAADEALSACFEEKLKATP